MQAKLDKGNDVMAIYCPLSDTDERVPSAERVDLNDYYLDDILVSNLFFGNLETWPSCQPHF